MESQFEQNHAIEGVAGWRKAIPQGRDRLQSLWLARIGFLLLCGLCVDSVQTAVSWGGWRDPGLLKSIPVSVLFALLAWRLRAATALAAVAGGMICFLITLGSGRVDGFFWADSTKLVHSNDARASVFHSGLTPLILLFALTFYATRLGRERKAALGLAEPRRGRTAAQVIANLGMAGMLSSRLATEYLLASSIGPISAQRESVYPAVVAALRMPLLAVLAEATADTVSSEIGQAFGGRPVLLTSLRLVEPGTDGAVSGLGTLAGIAAASVIAAVGAPAMGLMPTQCMVVFVASVGGLFFDSLLGATIERKGWVGNDFVNLLSTAFAGALAAVAAALVRSHPLP